MGPNQSFFLLVIYPVKILGLSRQILHSPNPAESRLVPGDSELHLSAQIRGERHRMRPVGENAGHHGGRLALGKSDFAVNRMLNQNSLYAAAIIHDSQATQPPYPQSHAEPLKS